MGSLCWSEDLRVGNEMIDAEHRRLIDLFSSFEADLAAGTVRETLAGTLDQIQAYTVYHFRHEEELFSGTGYPDEERHRAEHELLVIRVFDLQNKIRFGITDELSQEVSLFLKEWLYNHVQIMDRGYIPYISKQK